MRTSFPLDRLHRVLAALPPLAAFALQWGLGSEVQPYPWLPFVAAVFLSAWLGGMAAGIVATMASAATVWLFFVPPEALIVKPYDLPPYFALGTFLVSGLLFSVSQAQLRETHHRAVVAMEAARLSESRVRAVVEQAADGFFLADAAGRYTEVNAAGARMLGYAPEELAGKTIVDLIPPEDADRLWALKRALDAGATDVGEWRLRRKDGSYLPVEVSAKILPDGRWQGLVRDISERQRLTRALRESYEDLERAQRVAQIGSWRLDLEHNALRWTAEAYRIFGVEPGTPVRYEDFLRCVHPDDREFVHQRWMAALAGEPYRIEHRVVAGGEVRWVCETADLERGPDGKVTGGIGTTQDITERKRMEEALRQSEEQVRLLLESTGEGVFGVDPEGRCTFINRAALRMLGYEKPDELLGKYLHSFIHRLRPDGKPFPASECRVYQAYRDNAAFHVDDECFLRADGGVIDVEYQSHPLRREGKVIGAVANFSDISERRRAERLLRQAAIVYDNTSEGILVADEHVRIIAVNRAFTTITGYSAEEVIGQSPRMLVCERHDSEFYGALWSNLAHGGVWRGEVWYRHKGGRVMPVWENVSAVRDPSGEVKHYVVVFSDISAIKEAEERLAHLAHHDALTGLPNRLLFGATLEQALERARRQGSGLGVMFLDLDRFKYINDTLGHAAGDQLLQEVASRLRGAVRAKDVIARLGGDEFTIIMEDLAQPDDAAHLAQKVIAAVSEPCRLEGRDVTTSTSVGIALYPADGADAADLTRAADAAMYRAKERGRRTYEFFTAEITAAAVEHLSTEQGLRRALAEDRLVLHYQPQIELASGRLVGVEALLRWNHPDEGLVSPERFIPVAEETGLIDELGTWVIRRVCAQARAWRDTGLSAVRIGINVSGHQFAHDRIAETLVEALDASGLVPGDVDLEVEVTESTLQSVTGVERLERLRQLGARIAVDDFGTGYSSLSRLRQFPVDTLKIDKSFVKNLATAEGDRAIVAAVVSLGHQLGLRVIAEGVETEDQLAFLREQGCDEVQGFLCGRAMPPELIAPRLAAASQSPARVRSSDPRTREPPCRPSTSSPRSTSTRP